VSHDYGQTWQSAAANLKGETIKTLTEDQKNPDVLYVGAETGLFVSTDRAKSWVRVKANLPTVRIDEITLHPRDNAMILATHGRALWILDHIEPFQEYAAAHAATTDARLFTPPPYAMFRRPARDRNYEFWGDQTFYGENPPTAVVLSWINNKQVNDLAIKITDALGKEVREISGTTLENVKSPGIHTACWDLRVQPAPAAPNADGRGGRGERGQQGPPPGQTPFAALQNAPSPFGPGCGGGGGGGGGGFGGGGLQPNGPYVLAGTYKISLVADGKTVDTKTLKVTDDPEVQLTSVERKRMFDMAMEMHSLQPRVSEAGTAHASLTRQVNELTTALAGRSDVPADVKASVESLSKELAAQAPKITLPAGGRGGGGGGRGNNDSLAAKLGQAKGGLMATMSPGEQTTTAYSQVKAELPKAVTDLNVTIAKAATLSDALKKYNLTLTVPAPIKNDAPPARKTNSVR